jgi:hypothetical protein
MIVLVAAMTRRITDENVDRLVARYVRGESLRTIVADLGISMTSAWRYLARHGVKLRGRSRIVLDEAQIVSRYLQGESEVALSKDLGVSRIAIRRRLIGAGLVIRGPVDATKQRTRRLTRSDKDSSLVRAGTSPVNRRVQRIARVSKNNRSGTVDEFAKELAKHGLVPFRQTGGRYDLDLTVGRVAIEIMEMKLNPMLYAHVRERLKGMVDEGWVPWVVWIPLGETISDCAVEDAVQFFRRSTADGTFHAQYRIVRSTGEVVAEGRFTPTVP